MLTRKRPIRPNLTKGTQRATEPKAKPREEMAKKEPEPESVKTKDTVTAPTPTDPIITETPTTIEVQPQEENVSSWPPPEQKRISRVPVAPVSPTSTDYTDYSPERKIPRKKFNGEEALDTKSMRIMDMIYWNPKKGQTLSRKRHTTDSSQPPPPAPAPMQSPTRPAAPQVKIGPDGNIILDETSLVVEGTPAESNFWETVDDDRMGRKTTSLSFRNRLWRKGTQWTEKETQLFYEILRCTGPDFGLMHEYFPGRARCELKSKYNREERTNWNKLKQAMGSPMLLDDSLMNRVERLQKEIDEEAEEKAKEKMKKPKGGEKKKAPLEPAKIDWDESKADLVAEAEKMIHQLEKESREKARAAGELSDTSSLSEETSGDEGFVKQRKTKKKKVGSDARKIITAAKKQTKESRPPAASVAQPYSGFEEIPDEPEAKEEPPAVHEAYPVANIKRQGVTDPTLIKAARQVRKASEKMTKAASLKGSRKAQAEPPAPIVPVKTAVDLPSVIEDSDLPTTSTTPSQPVPPPSSPKPPPIEEEDIVLNSPPKSQAKPLTRLRRPPNISRKLPK